MFFQNRCPNTAEITTKETIDSLDENQKVVALILARGGSRGIPYKNLAKIANVSLLGRALRVVNNCVDCFDEVWVSTDDELIAQEARHYNANVHYRSAYSARDEATSIESIQEFLDHHRHIHNIALIQCTSVFIYEQYLKTALKLFTPDVDCVFSAQRFCLFLFTKIANNFSLFNFPTKIK